MWTFLGWATEYLKRLQEKHEIIDYATPREIWSAFLKEYDRDEICSPSAKTPENTMSTVLLRAKENPREPIERIQRNGKYYYRYTGKLDSHHANYATGGG